MGNYENISIKNLNKLELELQWFKNVLKKI